MPFVCQSLVAVDHFLQLSTNHHERGAITHNQGFQVLVFENNKTDPTPTSVVLSRKLHFVSPLVRGGA
jgi:hypothetical protein